MKKRFIICEIVSVFLIVFFAGYALAKSDDEWSYSQEIVITENSGEILIDYPISVILNSSNFDFSKAQNDGSDIRFFSGDIKLNYWIETWDSKDEEAVIWVKIPSIPANGKNVILMKYGNPHVTDESNGKSTFDFFDDFSDRISSELKWNTESAGGGEVEIENGNYKIIAPKAHAYDSSLLCSKESFDINSIFVVKRMKVTTGTDSRGPLLRQGFTDQIENRKNEITQETELADESDVNWKTVYRKERYNSRDLTDVDVPEGEWYVSGVAWFEGNDTRKIAWFKNGVRDRNMDYISDDAITKSKMHVYLYTASYMDASKNTGYMAVDYALVRKFIEMEPTVKVVSIQKDSDSSSEKTDEEISEDIENTSENTSNEASEPGSDSVLEAVSESSSNSEFSTSEGAAQAQENKTKEETGTSRSLFPDYDVKASGIRLSSPYDFDFNALVKELDSSGINTIFLSIKSQEVWQYERFVKMAHEEGLSVHVVLLEDSDCTGGVGSSSCQEALNLVLDYNKKSLAPFDGIDIYVKSSSEKASDNSFIDYRTLFETAHEKAGGNVSVSANIPYQYSLSQIEEIAPLVDFFTIRAYGEEDEQFNSESGIVDTIAPLMGEIRGAGSKGLIEISAEEGFGDKLSIQKLLASLANYYSKDSAFMGVSISNYGTYAPLSREVVPEDDEAQLSGFKVFPALLAGLGAIVLLRAKRE